MNINPETDLDLEKLFLPSWAQESANNTNRYAKFTGNEGERRGDRDRGDSRGGPRPPRSDGSGGGGRSPRASWPRVGSPAGQDGVCAPPSRGPVPSRGRQERLWGWARVPPSRTPRYGSLPPLAPARPGGERETPLALRDAAPLAPEARGDFPPRRYHRVWEDAGRRGYLHDRDRPCVRLRCR